MKRSARSAMIEGFCLCSAFPLSDRDYRTQLPALITETTVFLLRHFTGHQGDVREAQYWCLDFAVNSFDHREQCCFDLWTGDWWINRGSYGEWAGTGVPQFIAKLHGYDPASVQSQISDCLRRALLLPTRKSWRA